MALIMVDYENVYENAFIGCEFLSPCDEIVFFYSKSCPKISSRILYSVIDSGCMMGRVRLRIPRANALDFYIATAIGERFGAGYDKDVIILSRDKGYESVADYWKDHGDKTVIISKDIASGLVHTTDASGRDRRSRIHAFLEQEDIEADIEKLRLLRRLKKYIASESIYADKEDLEKLCEIGSKADTPLNKYLESLRVFGKKRGIILYSVLRQCCIHPSG